MSARIYCTSFETVNSFSSCALLNKSNILYTKNEPCNESLFLYVGVSVSLMFCEGAGVAAAEDTGGAGRGEGVGGDGARGSALPPGERGQTGERAQTRT